jgi:hypothetical protein
MSVPGLTRPCPLCGAPTPARVHLPPGACAARVDPVFCDRCWPARRREIAKFLALVTTWYRVLCIRGDLIS